METADELVNNYIKNLCDECRHTREPHEHRCLGGNCSCVRCNQSKIFAWVVSKGYPSLITMTREQLSDIILAYTNEQRKEN